MTPSSTPGATNLTTAETPSDRAECIAAVRESLAEIRSGAKGRLAIEYLAEVRSRLGRRFPSKG